MERTLTDLSVEGVKTRKKPNKHIVFAVKVIWSDGQVNVVSRRYSEFFELMEKLNEKFPVEAGKHDHNKRILPNLQAKKTFLLSSSVMKQLERITHFTKKLVLLPDNISQCCIVRNFFTPTEADIESSRRISSKKPKAKSRNWRRKNTAKKVLSISGPMSLEQYRVIADVADECKTGLDLKEGQTVEVIEKLETGWWLVTAEGEQGWVPASYLSNEGDPEETMTTIKYQPGQGECYVTNTSYTAKFKDELSFDIGVHLQVIEKNLDGWWRAIYNGCEGLVPAAYLKKVGESKSKHVNKPPPVRKINVLSKRCSASSQQSDMTVETLAKLRDSTFKSPEEKEEQRILPKRKLSRAGPGNFHLEMKKTEEGGWVPQVIPTTPPPEQERKVSHDKGFSLLKGFGYLRKSRQDFDEPDGKKTAHANNNVLKLHLPRRSKSSVSDLKSLKKSSLNVVENEKVPKPEKKSGNAAKPRRKSMVEELMYHGGASNKVEKPTQMKSLHTKAKYRQRWSISEENNFHQLPLWEKEDEKDEFILRLQGNSADPKFKIPHLGEFGDDEFSPKNASLMSSMQQEMKNVDGPEFHVAQTVDDNQTEQSTYTSCQVAQNSDSPVFVVTPPTPQAIKKSRRMSEQSSHGCKKKLHRKKSYSCSDLTSSSKRLENDTFDDHEDQDNSYFDEDDDYSSDEDVCTLEDLLNEERESKGSGFYYEDLPDKRKMSRDRGSFDSGMESLSPPSSPVSPVTMREPHKEPASNIYVAIADYQGIKEDGEVDLFEGQQVSVLQKTAGGWWLVEDDAERRGWAPSNFLEYFKSPMEDFNSQQLDQSFCYVGDVVQSAGVSEDMKRNVKLPNGQELHVVDVNKNGQFMLVRVPSKFAWISRSSVIEKDVLPQCKI